MLLTIDVGNTNISFGVFKGEELISNFNMTTKNKLTTDELGVNMLVMLKTLNVDVENINNIVVSSVVPPIMHALLNALRRYFKIEPLIVGPGIKTGVSILCENAKEVGADRIVNVAAAIEIYKRECIVIDFGTATTFDHVNDNGQFAYTIIMPGLVISRDALSTNTAKLPKTELIKPDTILTRNTVSGIQAGLIYGYIGSINYIVDEMCKALNSKPYIVATGGLGRMFARECNRIDEYNPHLAFIGMKTIFEKNK